MHSKGKKAAINVENGSEIIKPPKLEIKPQVTDLRQEPKSNQQEGNMFLI